MGGDCIGEVTVSSANAARLARRSNGNMASGPVADYLMMMFVPFLGSATTAKKPRFQSADDFKSRPPMR